MAAHRLYRLPNGLTVHGLSALDTGLVYRDIFEEGYARHGVTVRDGDCVFDVGANTGLFLVYLNQVCAGARVFAFEPVPAIFRVLSYNAGRCRRLDVRLFNVGVSRRPGRAVFRYYPRLSCASTMYPAATPDEVRQETDDFLDQLGKLPWPLSGLWALLPGRVKAMLAGYLRGRLLLGRRVGCETVPLSDVIRVHAVSRIDLLKVDAERSEMDILAGLAEEDWMKVRQAVVEVHDGAAATGAVAELLRRRGFRVAVEPNATLPRIAMVYATRE
jgi:FkbM family methyltransferase